MLSAALHRRNISTSREAQFLPTSDSDNSLCIVPVEP